ncbi:MAG TPA: nicotinate (nicotinamide) nucleotide adenylyltransferase [Polyangia bacterium]
MRVALFGGSFNPPHLGHQLLALSVLETQPVDALWFVPCFKHPFEKALAPFPHRLAMCRLAAAALGPRAVVSTVEEELGGESRTLLTVKALQAAHPTTEFRVVIGADLQAEVASWYGAEELRRLVTFIVVGRAGFPATGSVEMPAVSSTEVRARLARGESDDLVQGLVPRTVLDYIRAHRLYEAISSS